MKRLSSILTLFGLVFAFLVSAESVAVWDIEDTLYEGESKTYTINGLDYEISPIYISTSEVVFSVNDKITDELKEDYSERFGDNSIIQVKDIIPYDVNNTNNTDLSVQGDRVEFYFRGALSEEPTPRKLYVQSNEDFELSVGDIAIFENTNGLKRSVELLDIDGSAKFMYSFSAPTGESYSLDFELYEKEDFVLDGNFFFTVWNFGETVSGKFYEPVRETPIPGKNCKLINRDPTRDKYWEKLGLDVSKNPEITDYRIQWFSGEWSPWYKAGLNDLDWKNRNRRVWSYFTDHNHEFIQCGVISQPSTIYTYLNQKFELDVEQEAVVVDYNNMRVRLDKVIIKCFGSEETGACLIDSAQVSVSMTQGQGQTGVGTSFSIKVGESREVFGVILKLLDLDEKQAVFVVEKRIVEEDFVDIKISPLKNEIKYGDEAYYWITITDKHRRIKCSALPCPYESYTYQIDVMNLPFQKDYPKFVTLEAGQTKTIKLEVSPYTLVETLVKVAAQSTGQSTGVETPVDVTQSTGVVESVAVAQPALEKGITGKIVSSVAKKIGFTKVSRESSIAQATTSVGPVETSESTTVLESTTIFIPRYEREYKFTVRVKLKNNPAVQDSATALLRIRLNQPTPPEFPSEETVIELNRGWNLVSLPGKLVKFSAITKPERKLLSFVYLKDQKRYVTLQQAQKILGNNFREYLAKNAFWIYSYTDFNLKVQIDKQLSYEGLDLRKGWNLVPITEDMIGGYLSDIKGSCFFEKLYLWDAIKQQWERIDEGYTFGQEHANYGFIAKVGRDCRMGGVIVVPNFPEELPLLVDVPAEETVKIVDVPAGG